ncbi:MAG: alpha/beta fold hydrolase [Gemmatimonadales bacterium]
MKRPLAIALALIGVATGSAVAQASYLDRLPPLVDRAVFFGDAEIAFATLSPNGRFIAFAKQLDGVVNVWVKGLREPFSAARPVTADPNRPIGNFFWSVDSRYVLFAQDRAGDENFRVYVVDPTAPVATGSKVPAARDLTPYAKVQARIYAVPRKTPNHILVGLNDRDPRLHDVYRVDLRTAERHLVFKNDRNVSGWVPDLEGNLRLGTRVRPDGGTEVLRVDGDSLTPLFDCNHEETCAPFRFHKDGRRVYMITDKGERDRAELVLLTVATGAVERVEGDPEGQVDFGQAIFSEQTDELIGTAYTGDRVRIYPRDALFARDVARIRAALPGGDLFFRTPSNDDRIWIVKTVLDTDNGPNYLYDRETGKVEMLYRPYPNIPVAHMAPMRPVRFKARDGLEVPAYLTLPKGAPARNLAAVVVPHGGPWGRNGWGYDPIAQFLANRGYAVLQPNFRGSAGFGKRFLNLGNKQWGTGTMQHDITDGARWLVAQGIADPKRIAIMGGSYGGYATLAGVAFTPDVYAAGVSIVGPSSIITLLNSIPPYWEPIKKIFAVRVGDVANAEDLARLRAQSPLYSATAITAPLLVIQGANDPRVNKAESDQIVVALRDLGRTVEYLVAPDEGHGFAGELNNLATYAKIEQFLATHLGGRYQETMTPAIRDRLNKLTVDVKTLALTN